MDDCPTRRSLTRSPGPQTKPDPRLKVPNIEIACDHEDSKVAFIDVNILDSTYVDLPILCTLLPLPLHHRNTDSFRPIHSGKERYRGDVLIKGKRIVSVGKKLEPADLTGARVFHGEGRTLMSGMCDAHTHFSWTNSGSLDGLATMPAEEHTLFAARSARTFLDCGYTMCHGAASAKQRLDRVIRDSINSGEIPGPRSTANGQEVRETSFCSVSGLNKALIFLDCQIAPRDGALIPGITRFADTPEEIREVIKDLAEQGVDQIKASFLFLFFLVQYAHTSFLSAAVNVWRGDYGDVACGGHDLLG